MSQPPSAQDQERRYGELLNQVGAALLEAVPAGWRRLDLITKIVLGAQSSALTVIMQDGSSAQFAPPPGATRAMAELRHVMYRPELGAWLSVRYVVNPPGEFRVFYNYEHDPLWTPPVPPGVYAQDLTTYPRPEERVPDWLRALLGRPPMPPRTRPFGIEAQREAQRRIGDLLVMHAPADREQIRAVYRAVGNHAELVGHILGIDGRLRDWEPPHRLAGLFAQLRKDTYRDGVGTWTAARLVIEYPIKTTINYDFDEQTRWRRTPHRTDVLDELEMFPRAPERVPAWMKTLLPNAERVAEVAPLFKRARIFDHRDADGRPVVNRPPVPEEERARVLDYLNKAHVLVVGRGFSRDLFVPSSTPDVPEGFHTDGRWIWSASVPHYLAKHGVPLEPEFLAHLRERGYALPRLDEETSGAAYTALTGEIPVTKPKPAELSDRDRRVLALVEQRLSELGAVSEAYRLLSAAEGALCLERIEDAWQVADYERGKARNPHRFGELRDAGAYLIGTLVMAPSSLRAGGRDLNTARALNDWPVQPLAGEPPLTLLTGKRIVVLMPGKEIERYGAPTGNLTFAAGTEFGAMSLRAERFNEGPRCYRIARELRVLTGQAVPWHEQPGGGTAYLLPKAVEEHLADGSLIALS
ncbi:TNT domain-containing protein [Allokutzneria albata]|uniref:TNT domain-containing protein n=1 Tax=Allokutzneria albata TaxID=211114 RepID=A0A1G9SF99_ALLAB|nr:TNT domain-containing protein [Allokutzneria albata]SDM34119.1 Protein of unknown function [Allokutzneria albata]